MLRSRSLYGVVATLWLGACAHSAPRGPDYSPDVIAEAEIAALNAADAYDVIRKLRGNFLTYRGRTSVTGTSNADPTVYVDDQPYGPVSSLRTIPASHIASIRLYRSWQAMTKYGEGNMGGVIAVNTKQ